jgi:hypothetical protein
MKNPAMDFDYSRFYELGEGFTRGAVRVDAIDEIADPLALTRGEVTPREPIRFRQDEGSRFYDYVGTTWAVLDVVSDRVLGILNESGFTGWTTYRIQMSDRGGNRVTGYQGLAVTGRCGPIDDQLSRVEMLSPPVPEGRVMPHYMGLHFRPETWDGSDVFTPAGTGFVFVTEQVRDALAEAQVTNLSMRPLSEVNRLVLDSRA